MADSSTVNNEENFSIQTMLVAYFGLYSFGYQYLVKQLQTHKKEVLSLYEVIGVIEVCISEASYRKSLSYYCHPTFTSENDINFVDTVHPLLEDPIPNSHNISNKIILTGTNASGKSTFSRALALNTIIGQQINTCLAKSFTYKRCYVYTSMNLKDDLLQGNRFFVSEVKSLKKLIDRIDIHEYSMIFLDELFKGTNTTERIAASLAILQYLYHKNVFV